MTARGEKTARYETLLLAIVFAIGLAFLVSFVRGLGSPGPAAPETPSVESNAPANLDERRVGRVEVLNATRVAGIAREATQRLRDAGFDVVSFGNAEISDADSSIVYSRIPDDEIARAAAAALGIDRVEVRPDTSLYLDVSVVLGADWRPVSSTRSR